MKTITISTIIHRRNATQRVTWKTHLVNAELKHLANQRAWNDNDRLSIDAHIGVDGVHLNRLSTKLVYVILLMISMFTLTSMRFMGKTEIDKVVAYSFMSMKTASNTP